MCQHVLKQRQLQRSTFQHAAATAAAAVVARPSITRRRVLNALQALPLQAFHLTYEAGSICDV